MTRQDKGRAYSYHSSTPTDEQINKTKNRTPWTMHGSKEASECSEYRYHRHPSRRPASYEDDGQFYSFKTHLPKDIRLDSNSYSMWTVHSVTRDDSPFLFWRRHQYCRRPHRNQLDHGNCLLNSMETLCVITYHCAGILPK